MKTLRGKIILMVVAVVLICSAVLSAMSYRKASQILSGQLEATYSVAADRYAQELSAWIRTYATYIDALAADIVTSGVTEYDNEAFHKYLESNFNLLNDDGVMYDIYIYQSEQHHGMRVRLHIRRLGGLRT